MYKKETVITRKELLDAGELTAFVRKAGSFEASIWMEKESWSVNGKSLLGMASLALNNGDRIVICADGADEVQAVEVLEKFFGDDSEWIATVFK